jgi:predicted metal-dependent hydrolase
MVSEFHLGDIPVLVTFKEIRNVHLSVHPPAGRVTISAPVRMDLETIRTFTITKLAWIKRQRKQLQGQARETAREYVAHESHLLWGKRYLLTLKEAAGKPSVTKNHNWLVLHVPEAFSLEKRRAVMAEWYRGQIKAAVPAIIDEWASRIGVEVNNVHIQQMKTKWGSSNPEGKSIRLNTEIAKKPVECLEYVVVHEMAHFIEPTHNARFTALMDRLMPNWRLRRDLLNALPVGHLDWMS